jgi:hypothetical protein
MPAQAGIELQFNGVENIKAFLEDSKRLLSKVVYSRE